MKTLSFFVFIFCFLLFIPTFADDSSVNENDMFADTSSVTASKELVNNKVISEKASKSVGLSGQIIEANIGSFNRDYFTDFHRSNLQLSTFIVGNLMLDVRLPQGAKAFVNLETQYVPQGSSVLVSLREIFVDGNLKNKVFLRLGKQVLQWGRCNLWNPTDLINVEKKLFIQKIGYREGAYGVKLHIPFGTAYNIYGFIDTREASSPDSIAAAGKFEFMLGNTEMAFSMWDKKNYNPVFGYDFSTRAIGLDLTGELSVSDGNNNYSLKQENYMLEKVKSTDWQSKFCLDIGKQFTFFNISQGLSVTGSFYYNQGGYSDNMFSDTLHYLFKEPIMTIDATGKPAPKLNGTKSDFLTQNNLYAMNDYSRYYVGLDVQVSRLFLNALSGFVKVIDNIPQSSAIVTTGVTYMSLNEFFTTLTVNGYVGQKNTEYTFQNQAMSVQITAGLTF